MKSQPGRWLLLAGLALAMVVITLACFDGVPGRTKGDAALIGMRLMDPGIPWDDAMRRDLRLPSSVYSRSEAIKYLLCRVADKDPSWSRNFYWVGRYFILEDCAQAEHYLRLYLERIDNRDDHARELLQQIEDTGCEMAANWLRREEGIPVPDDDSPPQPSPTEQ